MLVTFGPVCCGFFSSFCVRIAASDLVVTVAMPAGNLQDSL